MAATPPRKPVALQAPPPTEATFDLLAILLETHALSPEQAERVRRSQKLNNYTTEQAVLQLGFLTDARRGSLGPRP